MELKLIKTLSTLIPDIQRNFNKGVSRKELQALEEKCGYQLPEDFLKLYQCINGEKKYVGSILGFELLDLKSILSEYESLLNSAYKILSETPNKVKEGNYREGWIPFADDGGGSFIVIDFDPDKEGKAGQVITIDRENDYSYVLADSISEFINNICNFVESGSMQLTEEECLNFGEGHLFDNLDEYFGNVPDNQMIEIDEYFEQFFEDDIENHCVSKKALEKTKELRLFTPSEENFENISLDILKHMTNLKELIIHISKVEDFSPIAKISSLRKIVIGSKKFRAEDIKYISGLERLNSVTFCNISLDSIKELRNCKSLKTLRFSKVQGFDFNEIREFKSLTELSVKGTGCTNFSFIANLTKLRVLEIEDLSVNSLSFLENLVKLEEFTCRTKANDENSISYINKCKKIKQLSYPIGDLSVIAQLKELTSLSIDAKQVKNMELLADTKIEMIHIENADSEDEAESIMKQVRNYLGDISHGWTINWEE